jgi:hypothetical protein
VKLLAIEAQQHVGEQDVWEGLSCLCVGVFKRHKVCVEKEKIRVVALTAARLLLKWMLCASSWLEVRGALLHRARTHEVAICEPAQICDGKLHQSRILRIGVFWRARALLQFAPPSKTDLKVAPANTNLFNWFKRG